MVNTSRTLSASLSRSLFSVRYPGLVHEFLKIAYPDQLFYLILKGHALVHGVPYVFVKGTVSYNIPTEPVPPHGFKWPIEISIHYSVDMVQQGREGMVVCIFWEWPFVFHWPVFCFFELLARLSSPLLLSCPFWPLTVVLGSFLLSVVIPYIFHRASLESSNFRYLRAFL